MKKSLDVCKNLLQVLPPELGVLKELRKLDIAANPWIEELKNPAKVREKERKKERKERKEKEERKKERKKESQMMFLIFFFYFFLFLFLST